MAERSSEREPRTAAAIRGVWAAASPQPVARAFSGDSPAAHSELPQGASSETSLAPQLSNYRAVVERAEEVLGSAELATLWLSSPNPALSGETPLQVLGRANYSGEAIEKYIEPIFRRIEFGIYA